MKLLWILRFTLINLIFNFLKKSVFVSFAKEVKVHLFVIVKLKRRRQNNLLWVCNERQKSNVTHFSVSFPIKKTLIFIKSISNFLFSTIWISQKSQCSLSSTMMLTYYFSMLTALFDVEFSGRWKCVYIFCMLCSKQDEFIHLIFCKF